MHKHWMIGLAACALALPVEAQTGIALAGVEVGKNAQYSYLGPVLPLPGQALGQGWAQRYWLDYTGYAYEKGPGQEIDASVGGVEAALGYTGSSAAGWWGHIWARVTAIPGSVRKIPTTRKAARSSSASCRSRAKPRCRRRGVSTASRAA
jgi:hypothetical protein